MILYLSSAVCNCNLFIPLINFNKTLSIGQSFNWPKFVYFARPVLLKESLLREELEGRGGGGDDDDETAQLKFNNLINRKAAEHKASPINLIF